MSAAPSAADSPSSWAEVSSVYFDLNGTLIDDVPRAVRATNAALSLVSLPLVDEAQFRSAFVLPLTAFFERLGGQAEDVERAISHWNAAMAAEQAPPMPGALELMAWLRSRGIRTGVVSAAGCETVRPDLEAHGLTPLMNEIHCGATDKTATLRVEVERAHDAAAGVVLYVGDTEYDLESARAAGALPIAITCGYRSAADLAQSSPWRSIDSLSELPGLL